MASIERHFNSAGRDMIDVCAGRLGTLIIGIAMATAAAGEPKGRPEPVMVRDGPVTLHALLWRPEGRGPFPAILLNHGSGRTRAELQRLGPYEGQAEALGPLFARHGYVFLYLF